MDRSKPPAEEASSIQEDATLDKPVPKDSLTPATTPLDVRIVAFPVQNWDRYEFLEFLGNGAMGRVYKALDPRLGRQVALKFIRGDDPVLIHRFLQEARLQAQVEHENVCKIHEAGEVEGKPYIAMQFIRGRTLKDLYHELTVEQKVRLIWRVAEGIQAAHRMGLVHRDIKPSNIMVETTPEGELHPYVMDFGLARTEHEEGMTLTGFAIGTPSYMSPEQALGVVEQLDRRTDIYSLGATMYEIFSGRPPFQGNSSIDIMRKVMEIDAQPLRKINPSITGDLNTITMKCLEKEADKRYESARMLAQDLQRYLEGEPIVARHTSLSYRLQKKIRKHKWIFGMAAATAVLMFVMVGLLVRQRWESAKQLELARRFTQEAERTEAMSRQAYLLPLHDVTYMHNRVEQKLKWYQQQMKEIGGVAEGPGYYALGRGYMVLGDYKNARDSFEKAWNEGNYRDPIVAYSRGLSLAELYQRELIEAERLPDKKLRDERRAVIEKEYAQPASDFLHLSQSKIFDDTGYLRALLAYLKGDENQALKDAAEVIVNVPWRYEAEKLMGDIYRARTNHSLREGDIEGARKAFAEGVARYEAASAKARSDSSVYQGICGLNVDLMEMKIYHTSEDPKQNYDAVLKVCGEALLADPKNVEAYKLLIDGHFRAAEYRMWNGQDPTSCLQSAILACERALSLESRDEQIYKNLGDIYWVKSEYETAHGRDPRPVLEKAKAAFEKALKINPNYAFVLNDYGVVYWTEARYEVDHGLDAQNAIDKSAAMYKRALVVNPTLAYSMSNLGTIYSVQGEFELRRGKDPTKILQESIRQSRAALKIDPNYSYGHMFLSQAYTIQARHELQSGKDPTASLQQALVAAEDALKLNPKFAEARTLKGIALLIAAQYKPEAENIQKARNILEETVKQFPEAIEAWNALARVEMVAGKYKKATANYKRALQIRPAFPDSLKGLEEAEGRRQEAEVGGNRRPDEN